MAAPTVSDIAGARKEFLHRASEPGLFCSDCTAYVGAVADSHACPGDAIAHVRALSPSVKE